MKTRRVDWARPARDDIHRQVAYIARTDRSAAKRVARIIRETGNKLGEAATGHPGRVAGIYEKLVSGMPYIIAYAIEPLGDAERIVIVRVVHTARDWREGEWPRR